MIWIRIRLGWRLLTIKMEHTPIGIVKTVNDILKMKKLNTKKITIKVTKKMSTKEFKKFKKNLKKAGFKGKIKRVNL